MRRRAPRAASSAAIAARTLSAVPTGTVDLLTTTAGALQVLADGARHRQHVLQVGAAVLVRRRADGDEDDVAVRDRRGGVGGEVQAAGGVVGLAPSAPGPARRSGSRRG